MLELAEVVIMNILAHIPPKEVLSVMQFVSTAWYEAANNAYHWRDVKISTLDNKSINGFLWTHGKHLSSLTIQKTRLSRKATYNIMHKCKTLLHLDLKKVYTCSMVDDRFCFLVSKLKTLKSLILPTFTTIQTHGFNHLCKLVNLETLDLKRNSSIQNFTHLSRLKKLKDVDLSGCRNVDDAFCSHISKLKLERIVLSYCFSMTLQGIRMFFSIKHPKLRHLVLNGINYTSDIIENCIAKKAMNIETISLNSLIIDQNVYMSLKQFKKLRSITIIGCSKIKDFRIFKHLENICICRTIFDVLGSHGLVAFAARHKHIKIYLFDNYAIGNRQELFTRVKKLNNVTVQYS